MAEYSNRNRAKVYQLNTVGQWDDRGTGFVVCQYLQSYGFACIILVNEEDQTPLLETRVVAEDIYQRQGETIISWTEPSNGCDVALSFADASGCADLWDQIVSLQRAELQTQGGGLGLRDGSLLSLTDRGNQLLGSGGGGGDGLNGMDGVLEQLPAPELRNIKALAEMLGEITFYQRPMVVQIVLQQDYVPKLAQLFATVEDLEQIEDLHCMFHIFRTLVMLNDAAIFEQLLRDDVIMAAIGALEYDPELHAHDTRHREFLRNGVVFKEVLPIRDPAILAKIHQNFRVSYIKDVVLPRSLDDNTFATLNSIMYMNTIAILGHVQSDADYLSSLFTQLNDPLVSANRRRELSRLLLELCNLARNLQLFNRNSFYRRLVDFGLFTPVARLVACDQADVQLNTAEVLAATCMHDPCMLRQFVLAERPPRATLQALVRTFTAQSEAGLKAQLMEVLRFLLDPETMENAEQQEFLNLFYDGYIMQVLEPLPDSEGSPGEADGSAAVEPRGARDLDNGVAAHAGPVAAEGAEEVHASGPEPVPPERPAVAEEGHTLASTFQDGAAQASTSASGAHSASRQAPDPNTASVQTAAVDRAGAGGAGHAPDTPVGQADPAVAQAARAEAVEGGPPRAAIPQAHAPAQPAVTTDSDDSSEEGHAGKVLVVELLCFCVIHHGYRIKYFVLKNHVMTRVLLLCRQRDKTLALAAVRFVRACVGLKDEFYHRYMCKNGCLAPLVDLLVANARLDNLLRSAIADLLEFIRKENIKSLLAHLYEHHREDLARTRLDDLVEGLWERHAQNIEGIAGPEGDGAGPQGPAGHAARDGGGVGTGLGRGGRPGTAAPFRAARRAPPPGQGLRAFPDEDEDAAFFDGSDEDLEPIDGADLDEAPELSPTGRGAASLLIGGASCRDLPGPHGLDGMSGVGAGGRPRDVDEPFPGTSSSFERMVQCAVMGGGPAWNAGDEHSATTGAAFGAPVADSPFRAELSDALDASAARHQALSDEVDGDNGTKRPRAHADYGDAVDGHGVGDSEADGDLDDLPLDGPDDIGAFSAGPLPEAAGAEAVVNGGGAQRTAATDR